MNQQQVTQQVSQQMAQQMMAMFDANGDGMLNMVELQHAVAAACQQMHKGRTSRLRPCAGPWDDGG